MTEKFRDNMQMAVEDNDRSGEKSPQSLSDDLKDAEVVFKDGEDIPDNFQGFYKKSPTMTLSPSKIVYAEIPEIGDGEDVPDSFRGFPDDDSACEKSVSEKTAPSGTTRKSFQRQPITLKIPKDRNNQTMSLKEDLAFADSYCKGRDEFYNGIVI